MTIAFDDPASDIRDEIAACAGVPELADKVWFHKTAAAVIDAGRCVGCGGCIAACPSRSISVADDGKPTLVRMCTGCSACWDYCPMAGLRVERLAAAPPASGHCVDLGILRGAYSARALHPASGAQDGGVVTSLLAALLQAGFIDGAIVSRRTDAFRAESFLATTAEEALASAGSAYHQAHPLALLNAPLRPRLRRIALVGTPCQLSVLRALQRYPWRYRAGAAGSVVLTVGVFCTRSFDPDQLEKAVAGAGVDTSAVARVDVRDSDLVASGEDGRELLREPVRVFRHASLRGCDECADFASASADIAVGNLASAPGRSTVLVRTATGETALGAAAHAICMSPLHNLEPIIRVASRDRQTAERTSARGIDPQGPLWVSYSEHRAAYANSHRAPAAPPAYRSHHYEVSC